MIKQANYSSTVFYAEEGSAMNRRFDPYHTWLAIPPDEQPADAYRLLGIERFEKDPDVIANAADRQMRHVKMQASGPHAPHCRPVLRELADARELLLNNPRKAAYDQSLQRQAPLPPPVIEVQPTWPPVRPREPSMVMQAPVIRGLPPAGNGAVIDVGETPVVRTTSFRKTRRSSQHKRRITKNVTPVLLTLLVLFLGYLLLENLFNSGPKPLASGQPPVATPADQDPGPATPKATQPDVDDQLQGQAVNVQSPPLPIDPIVTHQPQGNVEQQPAEPATPAPPTRRAPAELTESQRIQLDQALDQVKRSLASRDLPEAQRSMDQAKAITAGVAQGPHADRVHRMSLLCHYVHEFWDAVKEGMAGIDGQELVIGDLVIHVIEANEGGIRYRDRGINQHYTLYEMPPGLARLIGERWLEKTPTSRIFVGAFMAVEPAYGLEKAREQWQQAREGGADVDELMPILDEL